VERGGAVDSASGLAVIAGTFLSGGSGACTVVGEYLARGHPGAKATGPTQSPSQTGPPGQNVNSAAREVEAETGDGGAETGFGHRSSLTRECDAKWFCLSSMSNVFSLSVTQVLPAGCDLSHNPSHRENESA